MPRLTLTNNDRGPRGVNTADGLVMLRPGETQTVEMDKGELVDLPAFFTTDGAPVDDVEPEGDGLDDKSVAELDKLIAAESVKLPETGTGNEGRVVKADKVAAIRAHREKPADDGLGEMDDDTLRATVEAITGSPAPADADRETLLGLARSS